MNLVKVDFKSNSLEVVEDNQSVVVKDICKYIGIKFDTQYSKLKSDPTYQAKLIKVQTAGGMQEVFTIPLSKLNGWLFSINPNKVKPEVKAKLIEYKNECFDVLYNHFNKKTQPTHYDPKLIENLTSNVQRLLDENQNLRDKINLLENKTKTDSEELAKRIKEQEAFYTTFSSIATEFVDDLQQRAELYLYKAVKSKVEYNNTKTKIWI